MFISIKVHDVCFKLKKRLTRIKGGFKIQTSHFVSKLVYDNIHVLR